MTEPGAHFVRSALELNIDSRMTHFMILVALALCAVARADDPWADALQKLHDSANAEHIARAVITETSVPTNLAIHSRSRAFRVTHYYKPDHPAAQGAISSGELYILREDDDTIYRVGDPDSILMLTRSEGTSLTNSTMVLQFARLACHAHRVKKTGDGKWNLEFDCSGLPYTYIRTLKLDENLVPTSIGAVRKRHIFMKDFITKDSTVPTEGAPSVEK